MIDIFGGLLLIKLINIYIILVDAFNHFNLHQFFMILRRINVMKNCIPR